jgi:hypothetical protein
LIEVPDSDNAGVSAFLKILNKGMLSDPQANVHFFFVYWYNGQIDNDINDLLKAGLTKDEIYNIVVSESLTWPATLERLKSKFDIVKTEPYGYILKEELDNRRRQRENRSAKLKSMGNAGHGTKRPTKKTDKSSKREHISKKGRVRDNNDRLSWF